MAKTIATIQEIPPQKKEPFVKKVATYCRVSMKDYGQLDNLATQEILRRFNQWALLLEVLEICFGVTWTCSHNGVDNKCKIKAKAIMSSLS